MASINKVIIVGRLGQDPEIRQFQNGGQVANLSIATSERWTDKQTGEQKEATEWHRVSLFNRLAEIAGQYLYKGSICIRAVWCISKAVCTLENTPTNKA